ncbi:hypothetical protein N7326_07025 [Corynebacterium sp. ES2794-CONJ1]|uniref:hypothetical protein n=1 Tax=unclassified Corynebacterium TaxID=2624378 RepID=UPI002169A4B2|nr:MULTISPECIES: hypothetical protein [unclassified Corynebacterium]MCS4490070.1 hypothetical protein [Corynebacterium sp. ES2775-CONJ]MCS4492579.1 hypothetical protein [Corynebacterium sp. ES2715-CONJ3]MCS4532229.1 hypothetical protein [Corynebacterium sp. ES2730-CONJ]MCU9519625.1 hypothetical protein [Corynebacterium sp. ES2794-CONJ1]
MDMNALLEPLMKFLATDIGKIIETIVKVFYAVFYPANAPAATLDKIDAVTDAASTLIDSVRR